MNNPDSQLRKLDILSDGLYKIFYSQIDSAMKKSANAGKLPGSLQREKTKLATEHILAALQLPITSPANLQAVFIFNLMHLAGPRGGD